ncbi:MAG: DUF4386 family protein [Rubrivivax sp.]|nr:DUF4386 family protein [Rubrivivax sp.]
MTTPLPYPSADTASAPPLSSSTPHPKSARALGALLIAEGLLALAPIAILGPAIGWPASLDKPAAEQLAAIAAAPGAVTAGYGVYLLYSILIAPVMIVLASRLRGGLASPLGLTVAAFATLSALARSIGILRWLTVMPGLAAAHAAADPAARGQIELVFDALTSYGGGIGEILGVSLFMALALGLLAIGALRSGGLPTWASAFGLVAALSLGALLLPVFGAPDLMPVAIAVSVLSLWMIAVGVRCFWPWGSR